MGARGACCLGLFLWVISRKFNMNINDYIQTDFGHVKLTLGEHIKCHHCGMEMSNRLSMSLAAHISAIIGFVGMHKDCKPGVPHGIFGLDYGVIKSRQSRSK